MKSRFIERLEGRGTGSSYLDAVSLFGFPRQPPEADADHALNEPKEGCTMAERPFKNFFEARDALDAEILAGKLELSGPQNAVFRVLVEHALYRSKDRDGNRTPQDDGFVTDKVPGRDEQIGVDTICALTGLRQTAVKTALAALEKSRLIRRFRRPMVAGGRLPDRIRVDWLLPEVITSSLPKRCHSDPSEGPRDDSSYESPDDSSEGRETTLRYIANKS